MSPRTIFLSRLIGLYCILTPLSLVTHKDASVAAVTALFHSSSMLLIVGVIGLAAGLAIVLGHNVWSGGALPVVVTLVGWTSLVKGLCFLFLTPEAAANLLETLHYDEYFLLYLSISFLIGVYLTYAGFKPASR